MTDDHHINIGKRHCVKAITGTDDRDLWAMHVMQTIEATTIALRKQVVCIQCSEFANNYRSSTYHKYNTKI